MTPDLYIWIPKDRNTKFTLYGFCGVKYYLMTNPDTNSIQAFELTDNKYKERFAPSILS